jgi:flagellar motor switch/type III secretory pathway protein FliN
MPNKTENNPIETSVDLDVIIGRTTMPLKFLLNCSEGSLLEFEDQDYGRVIEERPNGMKFPVCVAEILANGKTFAKGQVCAVGNNWGVKVVEVLK